MNEASAETLSVIVEREMPYPPEKIWRALTQSHLIEAWLMKNDFKPDEGRRFHLSADWGSVDGRVRAVEPNRMLTYTWDTKDLESVVTWTLTPTRTGTLLRMEQTGFRPDQQPYYRGAKVGWQRFFAAWIRFLRIESAIAAEARLRGGPNELEQMGSADPPLDVDHLHGGRHRHLHRVGRRKGACRVGVPTCRCSRSSCSCPPGSTCSCCRMPPAGAADDAPPNRSERDGR